MTDGPRVLHDGTRAPVLLVHYLCPACEQSAERDAYAGPPRCCGCPGTAHPAAFMVPLELAHDDQAS